MELLANLRGLHVPAAISFWPLAPGWWGLGACLMLLTFLAIWWYQRRITLAPRRAALAELKQLRAAYQAGEPDVHILQTLSMLLRRYALACFPRHHVAGLAGHAWLAFLDKAGKTRNFTNGPGTALAEAPYQLTRECDIQALTKSVESWIKHVRKGQP
ncbi:MAG: DUF4381 family protein [Nitrospirales bacterium]|nr:DUF4381 family protein [Nitrospirales bacterium]